MGREGEGSLSRFLLSRALFRVPKRETPLIKKREAKYIKIKKTKRVAFF
jgi:hypothetical protein